MVSQTMLIKTSHIRAITLVMLARSPHIVPASQMGTGLSSSCPTSDPALYLCALRSSGRWLNVWPLHPHVGDLEEALGYWLQISPSLGAGAIWGVNKPLEDLYLCQLTNPLT